MLTTTGLLGLHNHALHRSIGLITAALVSMLIVCTAQADTFGSGSNEFTIDFVAIGSVDNPADTVQNANNPADTNRYGAVSYAYRISTYEISEDIVAKATNNGLANVAAARWGADRPAADISWYEAAAFVNWLNTSKGYSPAYNLIFTNGAWSMQLWDSTNAWTAGGTNLYRHKNSFYFLPSINEWYKAAYYNPAGSNYFLYPTASNSAPASVAGGTNPGTAIYLRDTGQGPAAATNAGGLSPFGTMGQGGNVWDWLETASDGTNNSPTENRQSRGGLYFSVTASLASTHPSYDQSPIEQSYGTGFRVASASTPGTNASLGGLAISSGSLSPAFTGATTNYTVSVGFAVTSITLAPTLGDTGATATVNGSADLNTPINLNVGDNQIAIVVTAQDGKTTAAYTITVTRATASTNANLSALVVSSGSLSPAFSSDITTGYTLDVPNSVTSTFVTPTASDATASITVNGSSVASGSARTVALDVGSNQITIVVTAQDGVTTKPYSITVSRASASVTTWTEVFGSGTNTFTLDFVDIGNTNNPADASGYGAVSYGYRMATYEIPQDAITKAAASGLSNVTAGDWTGNRPAANVSWLEAAAFVNWLNTTKGYQTAYNMVFTNGAWTVQPWSSADAWTVGGTNLYRHKDAYYFLPNENEWYKSAYYDVAATNYFPYPTASSKAPTAVGDGTTIGTAVYNGVTNAPAEVANSGGLSPYGTMGQGGNVAEWNEPTLDGSTNSTIRVVRGGNWSASASALLSSTRGSASQTDQNNTIGFRVATVQPRPSQGFTDWAQGAPLTPENLLKYAIGGASGPNANDGTPLVTSVGASNVCVTVIVRTNDSSLNISGQNVGNLSSGTWDSGSVTRTSDGVDQTGVPPGFQRQRFCAPHGGDGREFIRVQAGLTTPAIINNLITVQGGTLPSSSALSGAVVMTFQITKYEVTWNEWQEIRNWAVANGYTDLAGVGLGSGGNHPVRNVSWLEVTKWCNAKSEKEGLSPVYEVGGAIYRTGSDEPTANSSANGYRLPTEAEWDWAARGGQNSQGYVYSGSNDVNAVAWYSNNSGGSTKVVGTKAANELGIHDMSGNVIEMCEDLVLGTLPGGAQSRYRRARGGSSFSQPTFSTQIVEDAALARTISYSYAPSFRSGGIGFRLARKAQ